MDKERVSDHFYRLGISQGMKEAIEAWRADQFSKTGIIPSFSEATRRLIQLGLDGQDDGKGNTD